MSRNVRLIVCALTTWISLGVGPSDASAQTQTRDVRIAGGVGGSFAPDARDGHGLGGSLIAEYPIVPGPWGGLRLYGGGFASTTQESSCTGGLDPCAISSKLAVVGGKARLLVPIPYVGPYLEVGVGASVGTLETRVGPSGTLAGIDERHSGVMVHIPFSLGLAFGSRHQHTLSFDYFAHPGRDHIVGALAVGVGFGWR